MADVFLNRELPRAQLPLLSIMRSALRQGAGRVVLRVPVLAPHRRRVARALLQEGALAAGGVVLEGPDEDLLLIGADAARAGRLRDLLDRLLGSHATLVLSLERDAEALLAYAASVPGQAASGGAAAPVLAALDTWLRALPLDQVVTRRIGMSIDAPVGSARPAFLRLAIGRGTLARLLGPLGDDADLLEHGCRSLAGRLLQAIGDPAQGRALVGPRLPGALHLAVPPAPPGGGGTGRSSGGGMLVATLGLEEAADPEALLARRASLAAQGWSLEIDRLNAAALQFLAPEALPADWLRLTWSPALASPGAMAALARVDPGRLILAGVDDVAALAWGARLGLRLMEGRAAEAASVPRPSVSGSRPGALARIASAPLPAPAR